MCGGPPKRTHKAHDGNSDSWVTRSCVCTFREGSLRIVKSEKDPGGGTARRLCVRIARAPKGGQGEQGFAFANPKVTRGKD